MDDLYSVLLGGDTSQASQMKLADALRKKNNISQLAMLSGDRVLSPIGQQMQKQIGDTLEQNSRSKDRALALSAAQAQREASLAETMRWHDMQGANAADGNNIRRLMAELAQSKLDAAEQQKNDKQEQQDANKAAMLGNKLTQYGLPRLRSSIKTLNDTITDKNGDLEGVGYVKNLPGASLVLSEEGKLNKSKIQAVSNDLLAMYSGLAVTLPEAERRALESMSSGYFSKNDFLNAWPQIVQRFNDTVAGQKGGFSPDVQARYQQNGGMDLNPVQAFNRRSSLPQATTPRGAPAAGGQWSVRVKPQ